MEDKDLKHLFNIKDNELNILKDYLELDKWFKSFLDILEKKDKINEANSLKNIFENFSTEQLVGRYSNDYIFKTYKLVAKNYIEGCLNSNNAINPKNKDYFKKYKTYLIVLIIFLIIVSLFFLIKYVIKV